jgi:hypothetical protein
LPLAAIYLLKECLADPAAPFVEAVPASESLLSLVANTYINYLLEPPMRAREFEILGQVLMSVPLRQVIPHKEIRYLSALCDIIIKDFHALIPEAYSPTYGYEGQRV